MRAAGTEQTGAKGSENGPQRSDRGFGDPAGLEGELQETAPSAPRRKSGGRSPGSRSARFSTPSSSASGASTGVGNGIAIPHGKLAGVKLHYRGVRAARGAGRLRGARRSAGRPGVPASGAGGCGCRSPQGALTCLAGVARRRCGGQAPRHRDADAIHAFLSSTPRPRTPPDRRALGHRGLRRVESRHPRPVLLAAKSDSGT